MSKTTEIKRGEGGERAVRREEFGLHHYYRHKTFDEKMLLISRRVLLCLLLPLYYTIIQILRIVFTSVNKSTG